MENLNVILVGGPNSHQTLIIDSNSSEICFHEKPKDIDYTNYQNVSFQTKQHYYKKTSFYSSKDTVVFLHESLTEIDFAKMLVDDFFGRRV